MKIFISTLIIIVAVSCNTNSKKEHELLQKENELLQKELELTKKEQATNTATKETPGNAENENRNNKIEQKSEPTKKLTGYNFENFHISDNRVGIFSKGMTINDIYRTIPKEQIKKKVGYGEFADDTFDDYEIFDSDGKKLLVLTPKQSGNSDSKINRISVLDKRFKTTENIGLGSTYGELSKIYSIDKFSPDMKHIILNINHINAWFSIKKTELQDDWWDGSGVDKSKIPSSAKFDGLTIWWN